MRSGDRSAPKLSGTAGLNAKKRSVSGSLLFFSLRVDSQTRLLLRYGEVVVLYAGVIVLHSGHAGCDLAG
jgi:hypothetical protein